MFRKGLILAAFILAPVTSFSFDYLFQLPNDYRVSAGARYFSSELTFVGRIEGGPECNNLRVVCCMQSSKSEEICSEVYVDYAPGPNQKYFSGPSHYVGSAQGWKPVSVSASCEEY